MDNEFFIYLLSHFYIAVGEALLPIFQMYFLAFLRFMSMVSFQRNTGLSFPPNLIHVCNE